MVAARITCPDCKSVLKPAKPLPDGKKVKCPKCGNMFTSPGLVETPEPPLKKEPIKKPAKAAIKKAKSPPSRGKPRGDDEDDGVYSFVNENIDAEKPDIVYAPDMSIKDLRGPAQAEVVVPSNYIMLIGGLCCLCNIFIICYSFWPMIFADSVIFNWQGFLEKHFAGDKTATSRVSGYKDYKEVKDEDLEILHEAEGKERVKRFIQMGVFLVLLIYNAIQIVGAVKMQNLESRGWGIASSIMTLLPMGAAGISSLIGGVFFFTIGNWILDELSLPYSIGLGVLPYLAAIYVGATSLRTLFSQVVIDGFEYVAE
jgi:predicted Zn finger-like uncharacterized protein